LKPGQARVIRVVMRIKLRPKVVGFALREADFV
jgi:hypothetical protein